jgi:DNA invertase Pin-like site-specific DNA recombinase
MKQLFAYIRVSDPKQGKGVSLDEQRSVIEAYAQRTGILITEWFVEMRTAAKIGRPVFERMVRLIRAGKAAGFVVHKLDRTTRNWYDWAEINELLDGGVDIHVASEHVELRTNGSRLAADMEVLVAVHYIRNLRQEALKGIHGRLQQGILPNAAPVGYLDRGAGQPKEIDPKMGPLVAALFEQYATGRSTIRELATEAERIGLRNRRGRPYSFQQISELLSNPFYTGVIRSARYGLFPGKHKALVTPVLFERVQSIRSGKLVRHTRRFTFLFRRFVRCRTCRRCLTGSERKGRVYYRCPMISCPTTSLREDAIEAAVLDQLSAITPNPREAALILADLASYSKDETALRDAKREALQQASAAANARLSRLTDLLLDGTIDPATHDEKRRSLVLEQQRVANELITLEGATKDYMALAAEIVELTKSAETLYEIADPTRKRQLLEIVVSNCVADGKSLYFSLHEPFATIANRSVVKSGGQFYDTDRTLIVRSLMNWALHCPKDVTDAVRAIAGTKPTSPEPAQ